MVILYLCDREKCSMCYNDCMHTTDIRHALNFKKIANGYSLARDDKVYKEELGVDKERRKGKWRVATDDFAWKFKCSVCTCGVDYIYKYCPACGSLMEEEEE